MPRCFALTSSPPASDHRRRRPRVVHHPVAGGAAALAAAAPQPADRRRSSPAGGGLAVVVVVAVLHLPQDVEERVDVAGGQRERAPRRVPVLALGVVEEAAEERVGRELRAHHEARPLGAHVDREAPRHRRRLPARGGADPAHQPGLAPLHGS